MANRYAVATGNWSNVATWDGGTTLPQSGDTVRPNGFTVTIDQDVTVTELRNDASAPAAANGNFVVATGGRTINANVTALMTTASYFLLVSATSGTVTINGDVNSNGSPSGTVEAIHISGAGVTVNITGNLHGKSTSSGSYGRRAVYVGAVCTVNVTGSVTASYGGTSDSAGIYVAAAATVNVTGSVTGGIGSGGTNAYGVDVTTGATGATVTINGNVTAGSGASAVNCTVASTITINGDVAAHVSGTLSAIVLSSTPTVDINGAVTASTAASGVMSTQTGGVLRVQDTMTDGSNGRVAVQSTFLVVPALPVKSTMVMRGDAGFPVVGGTVVLTNFEDNGLPDPTDVRAGVLYGPDDTLEGSLEPALTAADVWAYATADADAANSIGLRLRDAATVATTGAQIAAALDG